MGTSPRYKRKSGLRDTAAAMLDWLNLSPPKGPLEPQWAELRELHGRLRSALTFPPTFVARGRVRLYKQRRPGPDRTVVLGHLMKATEKDRWLWGLQKDDVQDLVSYLQRFLQPLPYRYVLEENGMLGLVADRDALGFRGRAAYAFGDLLKDLWTKGPERLRRCTWNRCSRLMWDNTNRFTKKFCEGIHDHARLALRQEQYRQRKTRRQSQQRKTRQRPSR